MNKKTSGSQLANAVNAELDCCTLSDHASNDTSFASAYIRAITAIASKDGVISLSEFQVLNEIVTSADSSPVTAACFLHQLDRPIPLKVALANLKEVSSQTSMEAKLAAFSATRPLLELQGNESRDMAKEFAASLLLPALTKSELAEFEKAPELSTMQRLKRSTVGLLKNKDIRSYAQMCLSVTGDVNIEKKLHAFESGLMQMDELRSFLRQASREVLIQLEEFEKTVAIAEYAESTAGAYLETAVKLRNQVGQRLQLVSARIDFERETFEDDILDIVHDAGNAFQLEVNDRLATDQVKKADVWESIGRSTFAKEIERRIAKAVSRREDQLRLLKEDLRLFQEDMQITRVSILKQQHFTKYAPLMPKLRVATRLKNAAETGANTTLAAGATTAIGTGAAAYFLGASVVLPVIAPAIPILAVAMAVAGLIKMFSDSGARVRKEILHKREAFEKELLTKLHEAQKSLNFQLDDVSAQFKQSALLMIKPIILEAEASEKLASIQVKVARRLIAQSKSVLATIGSAS